MKRLAIVTTHPIQYYAPVFKLLNHRGIISIKIFYTWGDSAINKHDPGFNRQIEWDIPLLDGYDYEWVKNTSAQPGSHHFNGIVNPELIQQINLYKADAVLVFGWAYHSHLKVLRYFKNKVPVYFRGDSTLLDQQTGIRSVLKSLFLKWVYRHIDHAFYVGTNNRAYFKKYGLGDEQLSFAPHAVDNDRFAINHDTEAAALRKSLNIPADAVLILFAGKLEDKKAPELLLNAFIRLNTPDTHLLFAGNGPLEIVLKQKAGSNPNIHFTDFKNQSQMPVLYQACDIFCLPSKGPDETWGLAVNEAMACSKAVIISDKCGCAIDLVTENNGIIFKSENIDEITLGLKKMITNGNLLTEMGKTSGLKIKDWDFEHIAAAIETKLINEKS
ncbi:glycosyltransferase family 4 protein [Mucilaginibacter boryungensis]|uniref:Glycosyltransferase family 4 protein n=2 Tax=Mucilaginibacter boryungensis TaxID=768480 RepID=A0ABR9XF22_9SPHI|nr:glycosyltransferase family 4 protein [Mucilaginibacter boryungensis]MBE9665988.1 glycosyltransferase family 4 protein [Mucilaginibacter boryungensis]